MTKTLRFAALAANLCLAAGAAFTVAMPGPALACSGCGCNLDTDEGSAGTRQESGWSVDERVDYINQNHLMLGGGNAPPQDPTQREVQQKTVTVYYTTTVDYKSASGWGVNVAVPFQYRYHTTLNSGDGNISGSEWNTLSDIKVLGRYTGFTESRNYGVLLGLKLPTGATNQSFSSGPSAGSTVDPGLQPGTGTWDLLAGLSQAGSFSESLSWFAQELWQTPIATDSHNFHDGPSLSGSIGVRYAVNETLVPQLQINGQQRWREGWQHGGDPDNSGGVTVNVSPGLFVNVLPSTTLYGFVQVPVYQRVGGLELVPDYTASIGVRYRF